MCVCVIGSYRPMFVCVCVCNSFLQAHVCVCVCVCVCNSFLQAHVFVCVCVCVCVCSRFVEAYVCVCVCVCVKQVHTGSYLCVCNRFRYSLFPVLLMLVSAKQKFYEHNDKLQVLQAPNKWWQLLQLSCLPIGLLSFRRNYITSSNSCCCQR